MQLFYMDTFASSVSLSSSLPLSSSSSLLLSSSVLPSSSLLCSVSPLSSLSSNQSSSDLLLSSAPPFCFCFDLSAPTPSTRDESPCSFTASSSRLLAGTFLAFKVSATYSTFSPTSSLSFGSGSSPSATQSGSSRYPGNPFPPTSFPPMTNVLLPNISPLRDSDGEGACGTGFGARRTRDASCVDCGFERSALKTRARSRRSYDVS